MTKRELCVVMGKTIRAERQSRGLTIDELSELVNISPGYMGLIERGERGVTTHKLMNFSHIFGLPTDNFFQHCSVEVPSGVKVLRDKINLLTSGFSEKELGFLVVVVQEFRQMRP